MNKCFDLLVFLKKNFWEIIIFILIKVLVSVSILCKKCQKCVYSLYFIRLQIILEKKKL